ncbi:MAG: choice-of-anchor Q domain-containing protein [Planctomycetota bacterium]
MRKGIRLHRTLVVEELEPRVAPATVFVNWSASGSNNGTSWANAYTDLQSALGSAISGDEIWVADGTYNPDGASPGNRVLSFNLKSGVALYGGFGGTETLRSQRNWVTNVTILSGDLSGNDSGFTNNGENSYHVVTAKTVTATLDGFTISGGNANGGFAASYGGGMYNSYSAVMTVANCAFSWNSAAVAGGGIYNHIISASSLITNSVFTQNRSDRDGAGLTNKSSAISVTNCAFDQNTSVNGAGLYNTSSSATVTNCVFTRNTCTTSGAAVFNSLSSPTFMNCSFSENAAGVFGGAMYNSVTSSPTLTNCVMWGDTAGTSGGEIRNYTGSIPVISYCDIQGCGGSGAGWDASLGTDGGGNIDANPSYISPLDPDGVDNRFGTNDDGLRLSKMSPLLDAGTAAGAPSTDITGTARPQDSGYDMGAYECLIILAPPIFVDWSATGANNGTSWADAYTDLQSALVGAVAGDIIWVADGTYTPDSASPGNRALSFKITDDVAVYGGFAGTETSLGQRDWTTYVTILSGDLSGNDVGFTNNTENSYHVVTANGTQIVLDGFTISGGNANGGFFLDLGGGMYNYYGAEVTISNCTFSWNSAKVAGGGMHNNAIQASSSIMNCLFTHNRSDRDGAGLTNKSSSISVTDCVFSENTGVNGSGLYNSSSNVVATNCLFSNNTSSGSGGATFNSLSAPTYMNCTFYGNSAGAYGGAMYNSSSSSPTITNCILWDDTAVIGGNEIRNATGSTAYISYSDIEGCGGSGPGWNTSLGTDGGGNIDVNPMFINAADPEGPDNRFATSDDGLRLNTASAPIDNGTAAGAPSSDITGGPRPLNGGYDMGAYECLGARIYVDITATGSNNGASWANAYTDLQTALTNSIAGDEIWVADGTYTPDGASPGSRTLSFQLPGGVAVYGGFAGTETLRSQRNWVTNVTILSGDLNGDDVGFTNNTENSYHVVKASGVTVTLDGFTISGGNANGGFAADLGGGMYSNNSAVIMVANNTFTWNSAKVAGGGMHNQGISASSSVVDSIFIQNRTDGSGGGMSNKTSSITVINAAFSQNTAANGAAVYNSTSNPTFTNCVFTQNTSTWNGGAIYNSLSSPTLTNCTFSGNTAGFYGGAMYNASTSNPTIVNSILWGNIASLLGNEIRNTGGSMPTISYSDIQGCGGSGVGWDTSLGIDGGGNIDSDPLFVNASDPDGADGLLGTADDGLVLQGGSPSVNSGNNSALPSDILDLDGDLNTIEPIPFDIVGVARINGGTVDMGAYES